MNKTITLTPFQCEQVRKALKKRLQYLRASDRRGRGEDVFQKIIAIESILLEIKEDADT